MATMSAPHYTPGWKSPDGLVHITGLHSYILVLTECGKTIATGGSPGRSWPEYEDTVETPTCLMCIGSTVDYLP